MSSYRKISLLFLAIFSILIAIIGASLESKGERFASKNSQIRIQVDEEQWPLTDYEKPLPVDPEKRAKRLARGKKYDNPKLKVERNADFGQSTLNDHWQLQISALPTAQNNLVVIGDIVSSEAYLSNNKVGIYSEFSVHIESVLKDDKNVIVAGNTIDVLREGGRVRLPSGRITRYSINGQNMPLVGQRYVLFLSCDSLEQSFNIITGYVLRNGKVFPLDGGDIFDPYKDVDEPAFLNTLRGSLAKPSQVSPQ